MTGMLLTVLMTGQLDLRTIYYNHMIARMIRGEPMERIEPRGERAHHEAQPNTNRNRVREEREDQRRRARQEARRDARVGWKKPPIPRRGFGR